MLDAREGLRQRTRLLGPAFVAAVAYVDPGNVATNTSAGATYGYLLLWVLVGATLMAGLVQYLSAKVGWLTGRSLPELVGARNARLPRICYWIQAELVAVATDLAEIVGGAVALNLLFDLPLAAGAVITTVVSTALLFLQSRRRQVTFERVITGLLGVVTSASWPVWWSRRPTRPPQRPAWFPDYRAWTAPCSPSECSARR